MVEGLDKQDKGMVHDQVRNVWCVARPEERIRQALIEHMVGDLGFPPSHISVEMSISACPHLTGYSGALPKRRVDILCFAAGIHPSHALYPLLLIECKAVGITDKVKRQVTGYNDHVQARFVAVANEKSIEMGWYDQALGSYEFVPFLPPYAELLKACLL